MSVQAKMQPDGFEQLKEILEDAPKDRAILSEYVRELELHRQDEDIFLRLAFNNVSGGGPISRTGGFIVSAVSELYTPLDAARKLEMRSWWHKMMQREANQFEDLSNRLTKIT